MKESNRHESLFRSWVVIGLLLALILAKGFFTFFVVGDLGRPGWDYGTVKDVPAASPFGEYAPLPGPQHVRGVPGK